MDPGTDPDVHHTEDLSLEVLEQIVRDNEKVVVEIWAPWCHPCELQGRIISTMLQSGNYGSFRFGRLNADLFPEAYERFGIRALPAVIGFCKGSQTDKVTGLRREESLSRFISGICTHS